MAPTNLTLLDEICRRRTAFKSFNDMIATVREAHTYRPSLDVSDPVNLYLANAYDAQVLYLGLKDRIAYRYREPAPARRKSLILSWCLKGPNYRRDNDDVVDHWQVFGPDQEAEARIEYERLLERHDLFSAVLSDPLISTDYFEEER